MRPSRLDPPRNRPGYPVHFTPTVSGYWDAFNRAEYFLWVALRAPVAFNFSARADRAADAARARFWLGVAARLRAGGGQR